MKLLLFFFSLSFFSYASYYDYIYTILNTTSLYEAKTESEFLDLKTQAYKQLILYRLMPLGALLGAYTAYCYCPPRQPIETAEPAMRPRGIFNPGFAGFFFYNILSGLVQIILMPYTYELQEPLSGFANAIRACLFGPKNDVVQELEIQYILNKAHYPSKTQATLEANFKKTRRNFKPVSHTSIESTKEDPEVKRIKHILELPTQPKTLDFNKTAFDVEFAGYQGMASTESLLELERFCRSLVLASHRTNPKLKSALFFQGPPGVGKTEAALKLGKVLGIPVIQIKLAELQSIGQIKGVKCEYPEDTRCTPGLIATHLMGKPYKTAILFFDEAASILNRIQEGQSHELVPFMLDFLEGNTKSIENSNLDIDIDIQHLGIILADTEELKHKALKTRLSSLYFGNYTQNYRINVGKERFLPKILEDYTGILDLNLLTAEDLEEIDAIARLEHEILVKTGEDPGFRNQIRRIEQWVHRKAYKASLQTDSPSAASSAN